MIVKTSPSMIQVRSLIPSTPRAYVPFEDERDGTMCVVRTIPDPGFAGDDGSASEAVVAALVAYDADPDAGYTATLAVLQGERLLVPVVAMLGEVEYDEQGLAHDKTSDMATVLVQGKDGRLALLAFTSSETLERWNPEARPVPADVARVAAAAVQDDAAAIVVDIAGPVMFVVEQQDVLALADGFTLVSVDGGHARRYAWAKPSES